MTTWTRSCPPAEPIAHQPLPWTSPHRSYPSIISLKPHRHSRETSSPHPPSPDSPSWRVESPSEYATKLARSYHEQTSPVSSEIYDTPSSNTNIKPGSNETKFNHEAYISPHTTNQRGPPRPLPPPPHRTHHPRRPTRRGSDGAERIPGPATDGPGSANAPSGRPSPIDPDLHANPTRHNGSDNARPPTDDTSDAD